MTWINPNQQMPPTGQKVIIGFSDLFGNFAQTMARYYGKFQLECAEIEHYCDEWGEYNEELDEYFAPAGWYEEMWESEISWLFSKPVLFWRSLPDPPQPEEAENA